MSCSSCQQWMINTVTEVGPGCIHCQVQVWIFILPVWSIGTVSRGSEPPVLFWDGKSGEWRTWGCGLVVLTGPCSVQHIEPYSDMETYLAWLYMRNFGPIRVCDCASAMPKWYIPFYFSRFDLRNPLSKDI